MTRIRIEIGGETVSADLSAPLDLSIPLAFDGPQPNCFGAPRATRATLTVGDWKGDTRQGGSCNVGVYRLVPHCNGTHTECIGHVSDDETFAADIVRGGLFPATLISVTPQPFAQCDETGTEGTQPGDLVITRATLAMAFERFPKVAMRKALAIRTLPNDPAKRTHQYDAATPPAYLSVEAASLLVENGVEHLLVDVPSIDRMDDGGRLRAHRVFFGLPEDERRVALATRAHCSVTELIYAADEIEDGYYLLDLQLPSFLTDAAPSRPLLYKVNDE